MLRSIQNSLAVQKRRANLGVKACALVPGLPRGTRIVRHSDPLRDERRSFGCLQPLQLSAQRLAGPENP